MRRLCGFALPLLLMMLAACERERRTHREAPPGTDIAARMQTTELQPGPPIGVENVGRFQENAWAVSQGRMYYMQFNCAGCHAPGGGGGMGPPLNDEEWIYGSEPAQIVASISEGRPNGMPAYRGKISETQMWQLAAYVRSMAGLTPRTTWPARTDHMKQATSPREPVRRTLQPQ